MSSGIEEERKQLRAESSWLDKAQSIKEENAGKKKRELQARKGKKTTQD